MTATLTRPATRRPLGVALGLAALAGSIWASLVIGWADLPVETVWNALFQHTGAYDEVIVRETRLPRTLTGIAVGAALGVAGGLIQALTRNPLADPGILGVNAGAAFFVALSVALVGGMAASGYVWFAFLGALLATVAVYVIAAAGRERATPGRLVLSGMALSAVLNGIVLSLVLIDEQTFERMRHWASTALTGTDLGTLGTVTPFLLAGLVIAAVVAKPLDVIALGEELAGALGSNPAVVRTAVIGAVTLLAGGATALAGPVVFVGLMVPHVARWITGPDHRWMFALTAVLAPVLVLWADTLGRLVLSTGEVPMGVVVAFLGAPVLIAMVRGRKASAA
ncbi:FecCD family ABC transporter permease [Amycolatopsis suaedae]|uniref:Fe(3+)-siderophore ABC transporter permease n=1 Tax=Amycolatopsis suaedae TaxID=2510978 RepID=A0A4Q7J6T1_9PSEU|nr:iron chelate uptake ABC transporter family permease subunit [Amycolatopsis suaedae]RZQ63350.1 Fe(3+)-siderophore ABC transporter permease [Amycolatopsis suaedae]